MGSSHPRNSTRARKAHPPKKPRHKPAPKPAQKLPTSTDVLLQDDAPEPVDECLSEAWAVLDCAVTCLDVLAENSEVRAACQPADVGVLVRHAVELIRRAKGVVDLGGVI